MDHTRPQDAQQSKGSTLWHREHGDESADKRPADGSASPTDAKRLIRRVRSPSRPRAWLSDSHKPKLGGRFHKPNFPREEHSFSYQRYHHFSPRGNFHRRDHSHHDELRERERASKERYEPRESADGGSPPKQNNNATRPSPRSSSSRDQDMQFTINRNQSRERDHTATKSKERERSREGDQPPSTASQTATRDRAIQKKRREIDEVYDQECEMFGLVAKMLIAKDPALELSIQSALQENLRDIGTRCVEGMEKFIEEYDSGEPPH